MTFSLVRLAAASALISLLSSGILAQIPTFGNISLEDLTQLRLPEDTSAEACVIYDMGVSKFINSENSFSIYFTRTTRIKIYKESGYDYARIEIPLYREGNIYEKAENIEAFTYTLENGGMTKTALDPKNIFEEKMEGAYYTKKFVLPRVKTGSIIEYRYTLMTPYLFNLPDWSFQWKIPVKYSQYEVRTIPFYEYSYILQGASKFDIYKSNLDQGFEEHFAGATYRELVYTYGMRNLPAFRDEFYITCTDDYITKLDFQLSQIHRPDGTSSSVINDWKELVKDLKSDSNFGKFQKSMESAAKDVLTGISLEGKSEAEKIASIVEYVKNNYKWNGSDRYFARQTPREFLQLKSGNSAEINLFLVSLMNEAGLETYPVLLSTRPHGKILYDYPFLHFFNSIIGAYKTATGFVLVDATEKKCASGRIPPRCINDKGLVIIKNDPMWVPLTTSKPSRIEETMHLKLTGNNLHAELRVKASEYDAYEFRDRAMDNAESIGSLLDQEGYVSIDSIETANILVGDDFLQYKAILVCPVDVTDKLVFIPPFLHEPISENPFKSPTRNYPVDFTYPHSRTYNSRIEIPQGYTVEHLPSSYEFSNKLVNINFTVNQIDGAIMVSGSYTFLKAQYASSEYIQVRFFMNDIVKLFNEMIVLKKA